MRLDASGQLMPLQLSTIVSIISSPKLHPEASTINYVKVPFLLNGIDYWTCWSNSEQNCIRFGPATVLMFKHDYSTGHDQNLTELSFTKLAPTS